MYISIHILNKYTCTSTYTCMHTYIYMFVYMYMNVYMYVYLCVTLNPYTRLAGCARPTGTQRVCPGRAQAPRRGC